SLLLFGRCYSARLKAAHVWKSSVARRIWGAHAPSRVLFGASRKRSDRTKFAKARVPSVRAGLAFAREVACAPPAKRLQSERDGNISVATHAQTFRGVVFGRLSARRRSEPRDRSTLWRLSKQRCTRSWETAR